MKRKRGLGSSTAEHTADARSHSRIAEGELADGAVALSKGKCHQALAHLDIASFHLGATLAHMRSGAGRTRNFEDMQDRLTSLRQGLSKRCLIKP